MRRIVSATGAAVAPALYGLGRLATDSGQQGLGTASERVRELPGDELLPDGSITTYAITIAVPPHQVWSWLVEIGRGRGGFYTYTAIERLLGADIGLLDRHRSEQRPGLAGSCLMRSGWLAPF